LFELISNVYRMRVIPLDQRNVMLLAGAALLPFLPVVLMVAPLDVVLKDIARFLV
jgi:hypothetical protein